MSIVAKKPPYYQMIYAGPDRLPLFLDIHAQSDDEAMRKAHEWVERNAEELTGNYMVQVVKCLEEILVSS